MSVLELTEPHFIRCIKPNSLQKPGIIEAHVVLDQLRCNGILEDIRISRKGYPGRIPFQNFLQRYSLLAKESDLQAEVNDRNKCGVILKNNRFLESKHYTIGKTKVFLKAGVEATIEEFRESHIAKGIVTAQTAMKGKLKY